MIDTTAIQRFIDMTGGRKATSEKLGVSRALVDHMATGLRRVSIPIAKRIRDETNGKIKLHELRPDVFDAPKRAA